MSIEVRVPMLPESVADATVVTWHKQPGEAVERDENLVDLETDKVVLEVPAPETGVLKEIKKSDGTVVVAEDILAVIEAGGQAVVAVPKKDIQEAVAPTADSTELSPSVRRLLNEHNLEASQISGTGKQGRVTKQDVENFIKQGGPVSAPASAPATIVQLPIGERPEQRVPMSRLRARVAERLLDAQHNSALLTTFNEVNMQAVMDLRAKYKEKFEKSHGVKLGFMSFFTRAAIEALKRFPAVNASIDDKDIVYHGYYDIGMAVSTERGLVVPVLRNAEHMSMADIEKNIAEYAVRAREGKLSMEEMTGGTFTITNGGVFGSLLSTPILNPPQVAILGMHKIEQRAVVENGEVVVRPMMYLALTYDHRIIDGKESVQFLVAIKELLEDPTRLLLEI